LRRQPGARHQTRYPDQDGDLDPLRHAGCQEVRIGHAQDDDPEQVEHRAGDAHHGEAAEFATEPGDPTQVGDRGANDVDPRVGVVDPVDRHLVDAQAGALGEHQQLGVEEPGLVLDAGEERLDRRRPPRLEAALRVGEAAAQPELEEVVVGAGDQLALRAADHPRAARQPGADRQVRVAGDQRRDQRQQRLEPGREVDVHVGEDVGVAARPDPPQRPAASLLGEAHVGDRVELGGEPFADRRGAVLAGVVGDHDAEGVGEGPGAVVMQAADTALQGGLLVVDGDRDLDGRPHAIQAAARSSERRGPILSVPWEPAIPTLGRVCR
jgi:hypothetical protein